MLAWRAGRHSAASDSPPGHRHRHSPAPPGVHRRNPRPAPPPPSACPRAALGRHQRHRSEDDQPATRPGPNIVVLANRPAPTTPADDRHPAPILQHPGRRQPGSAGGRAGQPGGGAHRGGAGVECRAGRDRPAQHRAKPALPAAVDPAGPAGRPQLAPPADGGGRGAACAVAGRAAGRHRQRAVEPGAAGRVGFCGRFWHGGLQRGGAGAGARTGAERAAGRGQQPAGAGPQRRLCRRPGRRRRGGVVGRCLYGILAGHHAVGAGGGPAVAPA